MSGDGRIAGIPGVSIDALSCGRSSLRITLDAPGRRLDPVTRERIDAHWAREVARNPRLFDGPVLSCVEADAGAGVIRCRRASYRELVCQPNVQTGVMQLSVTGVSISTDAAGVEHVLLGRRARHTRIYGGLWELAPSGGLDSPFRAASDAPDEMNGEHAWKQLMVEAEEELTIPDAASVIAPTDPVCLCTDHVASSVDIVFPVRLPMGAFIARLRNEPDTDSFVACLGDEPHPDAEYAESVSIPLNELGDFDARHGAEIIAPTRALLRWFGWV